MTDHLGMMICRRQRWTSEGKRKFKAKSLLVSKFYPAPVVGRKFVATVRLQTLVRITRKRVIPLSSNTFF